MHVLRVLAWTFLWVLSAALSAAPAPLPPAPGSYVTDRAGVLAAGVATQLSAKLEQFEREHSSQVVVWIEPRIPEGRDLEGYANALFRDWAIGQKNRNNGILLLVFPEDRRTRIEVGNGLEGVLPDALAGRIISNEMAPHFRNGNFSSGVEAGVNAILGAIRGEYQGTGRTARGVGGTSLPQPKPWWFFAGAILGIIIRWFATSGDSLGRRIVGLVPAAPIGAFGWPMVAVFWLGGIIPVSFILGLVVLWLLGCFRGRGTSYDRSGRHGHSGWDFGGMGGGGWSGGWSSGGGGGFSGGGGSSSGGGASGSW